MQKCWNKTNSRFAATTSCRFQIFLLKEAKLSVIFTRSVSFWRKLFASYSRFIWRKGFYCERMDSWNLWWNLRNVFRLPDRRGSWTFTHCFCLLSCFFVRGRVSSSCCCWVFFIFLVRNFVSVVCDQTVFSPSVQTVSFSQRFNIFLCVQTKTTEEIKQMCVNPSLVLIFRKLPENLQLYNYITFISLDYIKKIR